LLDRTSKTTVLQKLSVSTDVATSGNLPSAQLLAVASKTFGNRHNVCCFSR